MKLPYKTRRYTLTFLFPFWIFILCLFIFCRSLYFTITGDINAISIIAILPSFLGAYYGLIITLGSIMEYSFTREHIQYSYPLLPDFLLPSKSWKRLHKSFVGISILKKDISYMTYVAPPIGSRFLDYNYYIHNDEGKVFASLPDAGSFNQDWVKSYCEEMNIEIRKGHLYDRNWSEWKAKE